MLVSVWSRMPLVSRSTFTVRFKPSSPPTPFNVKPKPSCTGVNSALMTMTSEKPGAPFGSRVSIKPKALSVN